MLTRLRYLRAQPRLVLSVMAANDLAAGGLVLAGGVYPALFECWPHGKFLCQMQVGILIVNYS